MVTRSDSKNLEEHYLWNQQSLEIRWIPRHFPHANDITQRHCDMIGEENNCDTVQMLKIGISLEKSPIFYVCEERLLFRDSFSANRRSGEPSNPVSMRAITIAGYPYNNTPIVMISPTSGPLAFPNVAARSSTGGISRADILMWWLHWVIKRVQRAMVGVKPPGGYLQLPPMCQCSIPAFVWFASHQPFWYCPRRKRIVGA